MNAKETMICWNPGTDQIEVGPVPDRTGWSRKYARSVGACFTSYKTMNTAQLKAITLTEAIIAIVRDNVCPQAVHREFVKIAEYRDCFPDDMPLVYDIRKRLGEE